MINFELFVLLCSRKDLRDCPIAGNFPPATHFYFDQMGTAILHQAGTAWSVPDERTRLVVFSFPFRKRSAVDRTRELESRKPDLDRLRARFRDRIGGRRPHCRSDNAKGR